ncbi:MAG: exodeoxyribonuclease I [Spirochaetales bacterium]|nr:exodeoxyribonuclease I [Spirochaetales bacterium]
MNKPSILWYDLETFGLDSRGDRIAQFAAIRTDVDLQPIEEPIVLYCKLSDDYLPDPLSCLVTGITPQEVNEKGLVEAEFIHRINIEFSRPNTTVAGFNSIRFDDEFIRNALYRNFFDPYRREYENNNSRWDIIDLVRATYDLRPEGIRWPERNELDRPVFRLTALTEANGIEHLGAHDALSDVRATIAVARLIREKQPRLYRYSYDLRSKNRVKRVLKAPFGGEKGTLVLHTNPLFSSERGNTRLILPLTYLKTNANAVVCFDLSHDVEPLLSATEETVMSAPGVFTISINKCPFVSPVNVLTEELEKKLGIDSSLAATRAAYIRTRADVLATIHRVQDTFERIDDVDYQIYDGFFTDRDHQVFEALRQAEPREKMGFLNRVGDPRFGPLLFRYVGRNWPEAFTEEEQRRWTGHSANRTLNPPGDGKMTWKFFYRSIEEKLESADTTPREKRILADLKEYGTTLEAKIFG